MNFFTYVRLNFNEISELVFVHLQLTLLSVFGALIIGIPLGILITYIKQLKKPILGIANIIQGIPSLAILGFLIPLLGIGAKPAVFMVIAYSILPIIKNTSAALDNINKDTVEAAKGIGMTNFQILKKVKLPLALPVIMAGARISAVTAVGLVTLAALIGAGGLGYLVYSGIRTVNTNQILAGAIPACIMALLIDFLMSIAEKAVIPVSLRPNTSFLEKSEIKNLKKKNILSLTAIFLLITITAITSFYYNKNYSQKSIVIGSKDFTEQNILGNIFAELIEANTDITVIRKFELGGTNILFSAIVNGELDMYVEYTGTVYGSILNYTEHKTAAEVYQTVKQELLNKYDIQMQPPLGFNNTFTLSVSKDTAQKYNLKTISNLSAISSELTAGLTLEFINRNDGFLGLKDIYALNFKNIVSIDGSPRYAALDTHQIQVIDAFSTDGLIKQYNLTVLEDDKNFFPSYYAAPVIKSNTLEKYPELAPLLDKLSNAIHDDDIRELNYRVDVLKSNPKDAAIEFLKERDLI